MGGGLPFLFGFCNILLVVPHRKPFVKMCMFSCCFFNLVYLQDSAQLSDAIDWFLSKSNNKLRGTLLLAEVSSYLLGTKDGVYFEGVRDFQFASSRAEFI